MVALVLDPAGRDVVRGEVRIPDSTERNRLELMMFRVDKVISRRLLIESLSGFDREIEENTLDTFMHLLPNKVDTPGKSKFIHTGPGAGYLIREDGQV